MNQILISSDIEVFIYDRIGFLMNASALMRSIVMHEGYMIYPDGWSVKLSIPPFENTPMGLYYNIKKGLKVLRRYIRETYRDTFIVKLKTYEKVDKTIKVREYIPKDAICIRDVLDTVDVETNVLFSKTKINVSSKPNKPFAVEKILRTTVGAFYRFIEPGLPHVEHVGLPEKIGSTIGSKCLRTLPLIIISILLYISLKHLN